MCNFLSFERQVRFNSFSTCLSYQHIIIQHLCTARAPCGIHLANTAPGVGFTAPLFLLTCYSQEVEVMYNDDLILLVIDGPLDCKLYMMITSLTSILEMRAQGGFWKVRRNFPSVLFLGLFPFLAKSIYWFSICECVIVCSYLCGEPSLEYLCSLKCLFPTAP